MTGNRCFFVLNSSCGNPLNESLKPRDLASIPSLTFPTPRQTHDSIKVKGGFDCNIFPLAFYWYKSGEQIELFPMKAKPEESPSPTRLNKLIDYAILTARFVLAWTLLRYGWSKLTDGMFGISAEELQTPIGDLSFFRIAWYFFDQEPFNSFIGISQIVAAILLLYNRTMLIGAMMAIPIFANILVIDITHLKMPGFYLRLSYYLLLNILIFWHYRDRVRQAISALCHRIEPKFRHPWWAILLLPLAAFLLDVWIVVPGLIYRLITNPAETMAQLSELFKAISDRGGQ